MKILFLRRDRESGQNHEIQGEQTNPKHTQTIMHKEEATYHFLCVSFVFTRGE